MAEPKGKLIVPLGFNPDGDLRALELDTDDYLKIVFGSAQDVNANLYNYYDGSWIKQPLQLGYGEKLVEQKLKTVTSTAYYQMSFTTVPSDEIWVITRFSFHHTGTGTADVAPKLISGGVNVWLSEYLSMAVDLHYVYDVPTIAYPSAAIQAIWQNMTVGDLLYGIISGYKIDVS